MVDVNVIICSAASGFVEVSCTHPLDVVKTLLQQGNKLPTSVGGFYAGIVPKLFGTVPMRTVYWTGLHTYTKLFESLKYNKIYAGIAAGVTQTIIDTPADYFKIRAINREKMFNMGVRTVFNGFSVNAARNGIFAACVNVGLQNKNTSNNRNKFLYPAIGGVIGALISQPLDYVKTHKQNGGAQSGRSTFAILVDPENRKYLMKGAIPRASMAFINMGIGGAVYTYLVNQMLRI